MGGVNVEAGGTGRRSLDSEINMIPMIDLLMVTISFLLITAVWSHMARLPADAQVPGPTAGPTDEPTKQLQITMRPDARFVLTWKQGASVVRSSEIPVGEVATKEGSVRVVRYPGLAAEVASEWATEGSHRQASDPELDQVVLHTPDEAPYASIVGMMDAVSTVQRPLEVGRKTRQVPAFRLTFAAN
jgi:biopolymer transport protein ExbD